MNDRLKDKTSLRGMVYASAFGALTALGAFIVIPMQPVPITFQTLFLNLAGALLGPYFGALSQLVYILLGILGLPVFAGLKGGLGVLFGPTGGYLIGFIMAAALIGKLISLKEHANFLWVVSSMTAGMLVIYFLGLGWLMIVAKLTLFKAVSVGMAPFIPGDIGKIILSAWIYLHVKDRIRI